MISPARLAAFHVLDRVEQGGYASDLLLTATQHLDSRDAGLTSEIVFGCLRRQAQLDWLIGELAGSARKLDLAVRLSLRMGLYQILWLERVPAHAAVGESVELVKRAKKASAAGFVNALLRQAPRAKPTWPSRDVALSVPKWLLDRWDSEFGPQTADRIAEAFLLPPETWVRNPPPESADLTLEAAEVPGAFRVLRGDSRGLRVQDVGSQSVVPLLDLRPGMTFLDLCAAPGIKTAQALETGVQAVACDLHLHRLRHVSGCARVALDATSPLPFAASFERILVDAPCSGTGTLARNPEIRWKLQPADLEDLHLRQTRILLRALEHLKPEGKLVYSTCSLERRENDDVIEAVGARVLHIHRRVPGVQPGDGFFAAVLEKT